jgi:hypothetical protein
MGINPINNISIIIRILFAVTLFQHLCVEIAPDSSSQIQIVSYSALEGLLNKIKETSVDYDRYWASRPFCHHLHPRNIYGT